MSTAQSTDDDPIDAVIHLCVRRSLKHEWVRLSRAAGMRLQDWIVDRVKHAQQTDRPDSRNPNQLP